MTGRKSDRDGEYSLAWPILTAPYTCRPFVAIQGGDKSTVALSLVRSISPDSVSKRKAFGGAET